MEKILDDCGKVIFRVKTQEHDEVKIKILIKLLQISKLGLLKDMPIPCSGGGYTKHVGHMCEFLY